MKSTLESCFFRAQIWNVSIIELYIDMSISRHSNYQLIKLSVIIQIIFRQDISESCCTSKETLVKGIFIISKNGDR